MAVKKTRTVPAFTESFDVSRLILPSIEVFVEKGSWWLNWNVGLDEFHEELGPATLSREDARKVAIRTVCGELPKLLRKVTC